MEKRTIDFCPAAGLPSFIAILEIPDDRDAEEYIDEYFDLILSDDVRYNAEWEFVDGIS